MGLSTTASKLEQLKQAFKPPSCDLEKCGALLGELKLALLEVSFMPLNGQPPVQELLVAREVLEIGARWSIASEDQESFERYFLQLSTYYNDFASVLPVSPFKCEMVGLNLLHLLCMNRIAEFHMQLELIPSADMNDIYIKHAIQLERFLMEGSYNKIIISKDNVPSQAYQFFVDILIDTIREEILDCSEHAYKSIAVKDATRLLFLDGAEQEFKSLVQNRGWVETDGANGSKVLTFPDRGDTNKAQVQQTKLIEYSLEYATELERIV